MSTINLKEVRTAIVYVLNNKYAVLHGIVEPEETLREWTRWLRQEGIIDRAIGRHPTYDDIIHTFTAKLPLLSTIKEIETHCQTFIDTLKEVGGPAVQFANTLREEWRTAVRENGCDHFLERKQNGKVNDCESMETSHDSIDEVPSASHSQPLFVKLPTIRVNGSNAVKEKFKTLQDKHQETVDAVIAQLTKKSPDSLKEYLIQYRKEIPQDDIEECTDSQSLLTLVTDRCCMAQCCLLHLMAKHFNEKRALKLIKDYDLCKDDIYSRIKVAHFSKVLFHEQNFPGEIQVTFSVEWATDEYTMKNFDDILKAAYADDFYNISLTVAHHSKLTFICTIPLWMKERFIELTREAEDILRKGGVVEVKLVIIQKTSAFSMGQTKPHSSYSTRDSFSWARDGDIIVKQIQYVLKRERAVFYDKLESQESLFERAIQFLQRGIIGRAISSRHPTYDDIIDDFTAKLPLLSTIDEIDKHCQTFIDTLRRIGGPAKQFANTLSEEWRKVARENGCHRFMDSEDAHEYVSQRSWSHHVKRSTFVSTASEFNDLLEQIIEHMQSLTRSIQPGSIFIEHLKEFTSQTIELAKDMEEVVKVNKSFKVHQCITAVTDVKQVCHTVYNVVRNIEKFISSNTRELMNDAIKTSPDVTALNVLLESLLTSLQAAKQNVYRLQEDCDIAKNSCTSAGDWLMRNATKQIAYYVYIVCIVAVLGIMWCLGLQMTIYQKIFTLNIILAAFLMYINKSPKNIIHIVFLCFLSIVMISIGLPVRNIVTVTITLAAVYSWLWLMWLNIKFKEVENTFNNTVSRFDTFKEQSDILQDTVVQNIRDIQAAMMICEQLKQCSTLDLTKIVTLAETLQELQDICRRESPDIRNILSDLKTSVLQFSTIVFPLGVFIVSLMVLTFYWTSY